MLVHPLSQQQPRKMLRASISTLMGDRGRTEEAQRSDCAVTQTQTWVVVTELYSLGLERTLKYIL